MFLEQTSKESYKNDTIPKETLKHPEIEAWISLTTRAVKHMRLIREHIVERVPLQRVKSKVLSTELHDRVQSKISRGGHMKTREDRRFSMMPWARTWRQRSKSTWMTITASLWTSRCTLQTPPLQSTMMLTDKDWSASREQRYEDGSRRRSTTSVFWRMPTIKLPINQDE